MNRFLRYSFASSFVISMEHSFSTQLMFKNSSLCASNYLLKDVIGQGGAVLTMHYASKYTKNQRRVLNTSQFLYQTAVYIDCLLPICNEEVMFSTVLAISSCLKTVAWSAHGTLVLRKINSIDKDNISETYMKMGAYNCLGSMLGVYTGVLLGKLIDFNNSFYCLTASGIMRYIITRRLFHHSP